VDSSEDDEEEDDNDDDDDDDDLTEANSSPDMCTMVPPFDMAYPEVDTLFAPGRHTPVDLLRELKLFGTLTRR
jgi:hypothetical protein